ncbi:MAG: DNA topoisomerase IV [Bacteroidota bacterium]
MFLKKTTIIISYLFLSSCVSQNNCTDFKTGKFQLIDNELKFEAIIERNDSIQTEKILSTGEVSKFKISWINDCEYSLQIIEGPERYKNLYKNKLLFVKIISTYNNEYTFESKMEGSELIITNTIKKLK